MTPTPTAEQLALARRVGGKLSRHLPKTGVMDYEDVVSMATEALLRLVSEGKAPDDARFLAQALRTRTIDLLRVEGVLVRVREAGQKDHYEQPEFAAEGQTMGVEGLEPSSREVLRLTYDEDMTPAMIAERTGRSVGSIYVLKGRALHQLRGDVSARELEVTACAANGLTSKETAKELNLSPETVKGYRKGAIASLNACSMTHAVALAFRRGLLV